MATAQHYQNKKSAGMTTVWISLADIKKAKKLHPKGKGATHTEAVTYALRKGAKAKVGTTPKRRTTTTTRGRR